MKCPHCKREVAPDDLLHDLHCDGQQGAVEALFTEDPDMDDRPMVSGLSPATWATSAAAAESVESTKDIQREEVHAVIVASGEEGRTDDQVQLLMGLNGSSERPRRIELWKADRIEQKRDEHGNVVKRLTRTGRSAVVWVARRRHGNQPQ